MIDKGNYTYSYLFTYLLECTEDDFTLNHFCDIQNENTEVQNKFELQICIEFIYRCLKCNLLKLFIGYQKYYIDNIIVGEFNSLEAFSMALTKRPLVPSNQLDNIDLCLWIGEEVHGTQLLDDIAKDCALVAYEDDVDFSTEKGQKFRDKIEKVWADNGLRWDLEHPLFPVPLENVATTDEQREEDRETEVGQ